MNKEAFYKDLKEILQKHNISEIKIARDVDWSQLIFVGVDEDIILTEGSYELSVFTEEL